MDKDFELAKIFTKDRVLGTFAEFIATFLFVFLGCGAVVSSGQVFAASPGFDRDRLLVIAIAHGLAIAVLVSATAGISGGHINPAVTFAMMVVGQISVVKGFMYIIAQLLGAMFGAGLLRHSLPEVLEGNLGAHLVNPDISVGDAVVLEIVLSFTLLFVIFGSAVDKRGTGNMAPLAIGFTVLVDHLVGVPFTGASMNPARSLGPAVWVHKNYRWGHFWLYLVGPLIGATLAAALYQHVFINTDPKKDGEDSDQEATDMKL